MEFTEALKIVEEYIDTNDLGEPLNEALVQVLNGAWWMEYGEDHRMVS